jgi:sterol desaturase/sphingolipid hydroxylase (fatty acid hydroxylase superfamily)
VQLAFEAAQQIWLTVWHVLPWLAGLAVAFTLLSWLSPCNAGKPWWEKRGLLTDLGYWIAVPIFTRYLRIWLTVFLTIWIFGISDGQQIADFYLNGHGPLAALPLWVQGLIYLVASDFLLYWIHRGFHRGALWKYHAIHHAPKDVEWLSAARFHPVNLVLGTAAVDIAFLLAGVSPNIFIVIGPFNIITSCMVHANLNWTFGPLRYVLVSPVFHRWHHSRDVVGRNFASTFALWDVMFGTYYLPKGEVPKAYGIDDEAMPEGMWAQIAYPLVQRADGQARPAMQSAA